MRRTRFLVAAAVILLASVTAGNAQTSRADQKGRDLVRDLERAATQDGSQSQQELRQRAEDALGREERDPVTTRQHRAAGADDVGVRRAQRQDHCGACLLRSDCLSTRAVPRSFEHREVRPHAAGPLTF